MNPWPPHSYRQVAKIHGLDSATANNALAQARRVQQDKLPAILTLKHLAEMTEVPYRFLRQTVERQIEEPYRFFRMRKRTGGYRLICVPHPSLFRTQKWLSRNVLRDATMHVCSRAYGRGQSIVKCAQEHCGCTWLLKIDIQQFFESISERQAYYAFKRLGYEPLISFELARICTRVAAGKALGRYSIQRWQNDWRETTIESYNAHRVGHLPQGAPTSPMLSNLAMWRFDENIQDMANKHGLAYTRYADDLIFSCACEFTRAKATAFLQLVFSEMVRKGLRPHTTKTVIAPPGARKIVLGLLVDRDRPRLQKRFRAMLEQHVYCLVKNGPATHAQRRGFRSIYSLQQYVTGLLNYAAHVDSEFAITLKAEFATIEWPF